MTCLLLEVCEYTLQIAPTATFILRLVAFAGLQSGHATRIEEPDCHPVHDALHVLIMQHLARCRIYCAACFLLSGKLGVSACAPLTNW